jgi:hypothetical protein
MHERVTATTIRLDKAIALGGVKPFHSSGLQERNLVLAKCTPGDMPRRETVSTAIEE